MAKQSMIFIRMEKSLNISLLIISLFVLSFFYFNGFCQAKPVDENLAGKIVARVNEKPIAESALTPEVNRYLKNYSKFGVKKATPELLNTLNKKALNTIIDGEVFSQAIKKYKVPDIDQKAKKELESQKAHYKTNEDFGKYLKARRLTEEELLATLKYRLHVNAYLESQGILHFEPAEEEIQLFYDQSKKIPLKRMNV